MQSAINDLHRIHHEALPDYKIVLVLGDMRELGEWEEKYHRELAGYLSQYGDSLFLLGKATGNTVDELHKLGYDMSNVHHYTHYDEVGKAVKSLVENNKQNKYLILFKGSQNTIFLEEAVKYVLSHKSDEIKLTRQ